MAATAGSPPGVPPLSSPPSIPVIPPVNVGLITGISAHKLQRKQRLEALVHQRISNFNYLRKIHEGGTFWLNIVLLTREDIEELVAHVPKQRVVMYYYLGVSIYSLLELKNGAATVRALSQLLEEFEYYGSGSAMQSMKMLLARNSPCIYPSLVGPAEGGTGGAVSGAGVFDEAATTSPTSSAAISKPVLSKFQNVVIYERLKTPHLAYELDFIEVLIALCEALAKIYDKLFAVECYQ
jgi:hypothetical protein